MKQINKILLAVGLAAAAHLNPAVAAPQISFAQGLDSCVRNCGQISQVGNSIIITLLDKSGKPFKVATADIDATATKVAISATSDSHGVPGFIGATPMAASDVTTKVGTIVIETKGETIVYTFTYLYRNGELVDVKVDEHRFKKIEK